jgi:release factor glutamine methyltransferase
MAYRDGIAPATPYSLLLAESIPYLPGLTAVDLGTGSGLLEIVTLMQGARKVYLLDTYEKAIELALENGRKNGVVDRMEYLPIGDSILPLPTGERVDFILSNPAQLPLPEREAEHSPFYAGPDGRSMIEALIREAPGRLSPGGRILMTHNSLTNLPKSIALFESLGFHTRIVAEKEIAFRPFIDRDWMDQIGGAELGLYHVRDGIPYELLCVIQARLDHQDN